MSHTVKSCDLCTEEGGGGLTFAKFAHTSFSFESPKNDNRFNKAEISASQGIDIYNIEKEAEEDKKIAKKLMDQSNVLNELTPELIEECTQIIEPYINEKRLEKVQSVLRQRTKRSRFLFENVCIICLHES